MLHPNVGYWLWRYSLWDVQNFLQCCKVTFLFLPLFSRELWYFCLLVMLNMHQYMDSFITIIALQWSDFLLQGLKDSGKLVFQIAVYSFLACLMIWNSNTFRGHSYSCIWTFCLFVSYLYAFSADAFLFHHLVIFKDGVSEEFRRISRLIFLFVSSSS